MNLKHGVLSYAVVGVWATPLPGIPRFQPKFLAELFGDPFTTTVGIADGSLVAQKMAKPPQPMAMFGPARFQVRHPSIGEAARVFDALMAEAHTVMEQKIPLVSVLGINTEHEWVKPAFKPSSRWLAEHYVKTGLNLAPEGTVTEAINFQFRLLLTNPARSYNIQLQPRAENDSGVFAAINDHREWNKAVPSKDEVERLLRESVDEIDHRVTPIILGGVADD